MIWLSIWETGITGTPYSLPNFYATSMPTYKLFNYPGPIHTAIPLKLGSPF